MNDRFDVFDSWGNKIGEFIPSDGSEGLAGLVFLLVMVVLWTVGFLIYAVIAGFKAVIEGNWKKAFAFWAIPLILVALWGGSAAAQMQQAQLVEQQRQALLDDVIIENVRRVECGWPDCSHMQGVWIRLTVTNNGNAPIYLVGWATYSDTPVDPGQTREFEFKDSSSVIVDGKVVPSGGNTIIDDQMCLVLDRSFREFQFTGLVTICRAVPDVLTPY